MNSNKKPKIVVLISGRGSNLQSIIGKAASNNSRFEIAAVISNRPDAQGLLHAVDAGIPAERLDNTKYSNREEFDNALRELIDSYQPDLVVLAGFMRVLTVGFVQHYLGRMINIHPSLLPKFPGLDTHQKALDAGDTAHGATVHFVTPEVDGGPCIIHATVPVLENDNVDSLAARVLEKEHRIFPLAINWFAEGRLLFDDHRAVLDGQPLVAGGMELADISDD
ncbi:MAG: phosphoribosylglycinamide formyltransferase [Gammaproteobacteria bacterium]|nr:MAG: phosphoribosylglycinamide formyltransferase [Gammaproteobacteria bacterium]